VVDHTGKTVASNLTGAAYEIQKLLNSGGYGSVYQGITEADEEVAIKVFHHFRNTEWAREHWSDETEHLIKLEHPFVVEIYDSFMFDGEMFIVLELAECSLGDFVARGLRFPAWFVIVSAYRMLHALDFTHQNQMIHRDVTPQNILYFADGTVKMADFGISKDMPSAQEFATTLLFNRPFVVPELLNLGYTSAQSDFYQLGLVLYSMLTGRYTIPNELAWSSVKKLIADGIPARLASMLPKYGIPLGLSFIIAGLLRVDPENRYHTAYEVLCDLERLASELNIPLEPIGNEHLLTEPAEPMPWNPRLFLPPRDTVMGGAASDPEK